MANRLADIEVQPNHRLIHARIAIRLAFQLGNFGSAARLIRLLLQAGLPEKDVLGAPFSLFLHFIAASFPFSWTFVFVNAPVGSLGFVRQCVSCRGDDEGVRKEWSQGHPSSLRSRIPPLLQGMLPLFHTLIFKTNIPCFSRPSVLSARVLSLDASSARPPIVRSL